MCPECCGLSGLSQPEDQTEVTSWDSDRHVNTPALLEYPLRSAVSKELEVGPNNSLVQ